MVLGFRGTKKHRDLQCIGAARVFKKRENTTYFTISKDVLSDGYKMHNNNNHNHNHNNNKKKKNHNWAPWGMAGVRSPAIQEPE